MHMAQALAPLLAHSVAKAAMLPSLELQQWPIAATALLALLLLHQE